jgi:heme/copper-type cytochrome/quinol oxidase subunit 2
MTRTRQILGTLMIGAGACLLASPLVTRAVAGGRAAGQEEAPNRREFDLTASNYRFSPDRLEVSKDDLVKLTIHSRDVAYSLTIDPPYRISKRVPAGGTVTFEFRADQAGDFPFYSNLTSDSRHQQTRGTLVVRPR